MKLYLKISALGAAMAFSAVFASATTIGSSTSTGYYGVVAPGAYPNPTAFGPPSSPINQAVVLSDGGVWDPAFSGSSWVGAASNFAPGTNDNPDFGYYLYGYKFGTAGTLTDLNVMADDTVSVWLNGQELIQPGDLGNNTHCSDAAPSCTQLLQGAFNGSAGFNSGDTLWFIVEQAGTGPAGGSGDPSGLDFVGNYESTAVAPEPGTLLLLGTGLIGSAGALMRRMKISK